MKTDDLVLTALLFLPALVGIGSFVVGSLLVFSAIGKEGATRVLLLMVGGVMVTVGLGIGACYGALALS